jgi:hypothetical protein
MYANTNTIEINNTLDHNSIEQIIGENYEDILFLSIMPDIQIIS